MGDLDATFVEAFSDEDYRRATGLVRVLMPDGRLDPKAPVPALEGAVLREAYRTMLRVRVLGDEARALAAAERIAATPETSGLEAAVVGAAAALGADDVIAPGPRDTGAALYRGLAVNAVVAQLLGTANDLARGRQSPGCVTSPRALNVLPASPHSATRLPHAAGVAWAMKMQRRSSVALAFLDAPETSAEDFHAGLNFAGVYRLPVVFLCINDRASAQPGATPETVSETYAVKTLAYGLAANRVDGDDLFAVEAAVREAAERARSGGGATFIEAVVERADGLDRFRAFLAAQNILTADAESRLRGEVEAEVRAAFVAEEIVGPPPLESLIEDVWARPTAALEEQLAAAETFREEKTKG
jgi:2-oxoisovalerate dehydrogenase E1 component alpha subunit